MEIDFRKMNDWEMQKATFLLFIAQRLQMDVNSVGSIVSVNENSGHTYLWCEDYNFTLFMPIDCELNKTGVYVMWTNNETGEETEECLTEFNNLKDIENWVNELELTSKN